MSSLDMKAVADAIDATNPVNVQWAAVKAADKDAVKAETDKFVAMMNLDALKQTNITAQLQLALEDGNKKTAGAREAASLAVTELTKIGTPAESSCIPLMRALLKCTGDAAKPVQVAAAAAVEALAKILSAHAFNLILPQMLEAMNAANKWQTVVGALKLYSAACNHEDEAARKHVMDSMPDAVPAILPLLTDFKKEVAAASLTALDGCSALVVNRDLEPLLPEVRKALCDIKERAECVMTLASTTFVSTVNAPALAIIMPMLVSGFGERHTATKRMCARIVTNMLKLVEDPREATAFLPFLEGALTKAKNEMSDPEARKVCEDAHAQIVRLSELVAERGQLPDLKQQSARVEDLLKGQKAGLKGLDAVNLSYAASLCGALSFTGCWEPAEWERCVAPYVSGADVAAVRDVCFKEFRTKDEMEQDEDESGEELCNCKFTLAYGSKILLHNTQMRLLRGEHYGLLGGNDSGKTTLMRAISKEQVDGFPPASVLKTVFVQADILGDLSHLSCLDYVFEDEAIKAMDIPRDRVAEVMATVGFKEDGKARPNDPVDSLSGGWRMKLALARAMLQNADILLMDEPTNHLDVINVEWVINYLKSLKGVTSIIVSHDKKLLDQVCTNMLQIDSLKLRSFKGNLTAFVKKVPTALTYFDFKESKLSFKFPQPGPIEGVKNKGKALMKMDKVAFTYPGNDKPTISNITVRASLASRVACVGVNGAGKSTMIKLLTGELVPQEGVVWKHPACRVGYIAQHAFHHIEMHLNKTPNEYIQWRYQSGEDKETLVKETMIITDEEAAKCAQPVPIEITTDSGSVIKTKRVIEKLTGSRRNAKKDHEYECSFKGMDMDSNMYLSTAALSTFGFTKHMKKVDEREALRAGIYVKPVTKKNVEEHLDNVGLAPEFGTHHRMSALSGGQKVKVVLAASLWNQPHILILDEPTNYLDRESLGALAEAIRVYDGGVVMITHNNDFCSELCPETWVLENGTLDCRGDPEWMAEALKTKIDPSANQAAAADLKDALGNTVKVKSKKKLSNKEKKAKQKARAFKIANGLDVSSDEEDWA